MHNDWRQRITLALAALVLMGTLGCSWAAQEDNTAKSGIDAVEPSETHPRKARIIGQLLANQHFRDRQINDELSAEVLDAYLEALDPDRYYFTQQDIREFRAHDDQLDDMLREGDLELPFAIFQRLQERALGRAVFAQQVLDNGLDLNTDATFDLNRRDTEWVADEAALDTLWRKRIRNDALTMLLGEEDQERTMELLRSRYDNVAENMERRSAEEIFETYMGAWARSFDPHTSYLSPRNSEDFDIQMQLSLEGIGAMLRNERDFTEIVELVPGGPADQSGQLSPGDRIIGVGQEGEEMQDVVGWRLRDVVDRIRGPKGSEVRLRILPDGESDGAMHTVTIERNEVELEEQAAQRDIREIERNGSTHRVGVITVPTFYTDFAAAQAGEEDYRSTTRDVRRHIEALEEDGIDALIVDVRGNSGGSLREAVDMSGLFLPGGPIVQIERSDGGRETMEDPENSVAYDGPLAVMVDRRSASASEIFAGAMQDYDRGVIVGHRTFGKGTVQTMVDLGRFQKNGGDESGRLKLTVAKFYRITGSSTQMRGVEPDIELPSVIDEDEVGERAADNALPWDEIDPVPFETRGGRQHLDALRERHNERIDSHEAYQALQDQLDYVRSMRDETTVSLNRETRASNREERNERRLELANRHRRIAGKEPVDEVSDLDREDRPETMVEVTAEIAIDIHLLRNEPRIARSWQGDPDS